MLALMKYLALVCLLLTVSFAQDGLETIDEYVEEAKVGPSPDVVTTSVFPRYPDNALPLGKPLEVLFGFKNNGLHTFNVTVFYGSLMFTEDPSVHLQNFTLRRQNQIVRGGESWSFSYWFMPDPLLEPKDYFFLGVVEYKDEDNTNFTSTWFNSTIVLVEAESALDLQSFLSSLFGFGILGGAAFIVFKTFAPSAPVKVQKKKDNRPLKASTSSDWADNTAMNQWKQQKSTKKASGKK